MNFALCLIPRLTLDSAASTNSEINNNNNNLVAHTDVSGKAFSLYVVINLPAVSLRA